MFIWCLDMALGAGDSKPTSWMKSACTLSFKLKQGIQTQCDTMQGLRQVHTDFVVHNSNGWQCHRMGWLLFTAVFGVFLVW